MLGAKLCSALKRPLARYGSADALADTPAPIREEPFSPAGRRRSDGLPMVAGRPEFAGSVGTSVVAGARSGNAVVISTHPGAQRLNCRQEAHTRRGQLMVHPRGSDRVDGAPDQGVAFKVT
jgi:hypothetical protein